MLRADCTRWGSVKPRSSFPARFLGCPTWPRGLLRAVRYCISSLPVDAGELLELVRGYWGLENGLHRTLDVQFRENDGRLRDGHAPAVMGIPGRVALNMARTVQQNCRPDLSIGLLQDKIGCWP